MTPKLSKVWMPLDEFTELAGQMKQAAEDAATHAGKQLTSR